MERPPLGRYGPGRRAWRWDWAAWPLEGDLFLLDTNIAGMFAAGDVRHGSIKRCAAAVGEGSMAIAVAHQYLGELRAVSQPQLSAWISTMSADSVR